MFSAGILCVVLYWNSPARDIQVVNMVHMPGMQGYAVVLAGLLVMANALALFVVLQAQKSEGWRSHLVVLAVASSAGILMGGHRLLVVALPDVAGWGYSAVAWSLALFCAGGFFLLH